GQSFELQIKQTSGNVAAAFHRAHQSRYGYSQVENAVEIVSARLRSSGVVDKTKPNASGSGRLATVAPHDSAQAYLDRKKVRANIYRREDLANGASLRVPCIVTE